MSFIRLRGKTKLMHFKKGDTTHSLRAGGVVRLDDSANLVPLLNDTSDFRALGVCRQTVTITDSSQLSIPVEVPVENGVEWLIDTDSDAGASASDVGRYCAFDTATASDSESARVDISDTTIRAVFITGIVSASKVRGILAKQAFGFGARDTA